MASATESIPTTKPLFGIVVVARNESDPQRLPRLLQSLEPFLQRGGEVLLADTGSTDSTREIATKAGARVETFGQKFLKTLLPDQVIKANELFDIVNWHDLPEEELSKPFLAFGPARTAGAEACVSDYVLHLDCGDCVEKMDIDAIDAILSQNPFCVIHTQHVLGASAADGVDFLSPSVRFYDTRSWEYVGNAHEFVQAKVGGKHPAKIAQRVDIGLHILKVRYTRRDCPRGYVPALLMQILEEPKVFRWHYYLMRELYYAKRWAMVVRAIPNTFSMCGSSGWSEERSQLFNFAGEAHVHLKDHTKAIECFARGLAENPLRRESYLRIAMVFLADKQYSAAVGFAEAAQNITKCNGLYENNRNYTVIPSDVAYASRYWLGEHARSFRQWLKCRHLEPSNTRFEGDSSFFATLHPSLTYWTVPCCNLARERIFLDLPHDLMDCAWDNNEFGPNSYQHKLSAQVKATLAELNQEENDVRSVTPVANGTVAIELVCRLLKSDLEANSSYKPLVLVPSFTFMASWTAPDWAGCEVEFIDLDDEGKCNSTTSNYCVSPASVRRALHKGVDCVMVVSLFGQCPDWPGIRAVVDEFNEEHNLNVIIIEDAAQAFGTKGCVGNKDVEASTVSFYPSKGLGTYGEGGLVVLTNRAQKEWDELLVSMCNHGRAASSPGGAVAETGFGGTNARMGAVESAVVLAKLPNLTKMRSERVRVASRYRQFVNDWPHQATFPICEMGWKETDMLNQYALELDPLHRDALEAFMKAEPNRVDARVFYRNPGGDVPAAMAAGKRVLCLPIWPFMTDAEQDVVISKFGEFFASLTSDLPDAKE